MSDDRRLRQLLNANPRVGDERGPWHAEGRLAYHDHPGTAFLLRHRDGHAEWRGDDAVLTMALPFRGPTP